MIIIIMARDQNFLIGAKTEYGMPWHIPAELAFFKDKTLGHDVLMGKSTYDLIGALPGRTNYVLTHHSIKEATQVSDLPAFLNKYKQSDEILYVIGGAELYQQTFKSADYYYISVIKGHYVGNTYFKYDESVLSCVKKTSFDAFEVYEYKRKK